MAQAFNNKSDPLKGVATVGGTTGFLSWDDLEQSLRRGGVVRPSETIVRYIVGEAGLSFVVERI